MLYKNKTIKNKIIKNITTLNSNRLRLHITFTLLLIFTVFCANSRMVHGKTYRPRSRKLENYVRIDMACPPTAMGISAAFPLEEQPLNILYEEKLNWYIDNVFTDDFLNTYEFRRVAGRYVCYPKGSNDPVRLKETVFPPSLSPLYKSVIAQSNTGVYSDLELKESLDCFGIGGKGLAGQDMTSMLNIPFKTSRNVTLKKDYDDVNGMEFDVKDNTKFDVMFSNPDDDINDDILKGYHKGLFSSPGNITYKANFVFGANFDSTVGSTKSGSNAIVHTTTRTVDMQPHIAPPAEMTAASTAAWFETSTTKKIQIQGWPYAGSKGWSDLSSFSEIGELSAGSSGRTSSTSPPLGGGGLSTGKPATVIFVTPLAALDAGLASLAIRKEIIRALRTRWLFTEKPDVKFVAAAHSLNLNEALLRTTPALWDYLAHNNAMEALKWANAYGTVGPIPRARMFRDYGTVVGHLMHASGRPPSMVELPDYHKNSYYFPYDRPADNYYATAVYTAWKEIFNSKVLDALLRPSGILSMVNKKRVERVTKAISNAIFNGYCKDTKTALTFEEHKRRLLQLYPSVTQPQLSSKYKINVASIRGKYTDLEWIANSIEPYNSGSSTVPSTVLTGSATLMNAVELDKCGLGPIVYPFSPLRNSQQGKKLLAFIKGQPAFGQTTLIPGISSIEGLPITTVPKNLYVLDVDPVTAKKFKAMTTAFFSNNFTSLARGTSASSLTTWDSVRAEKATSSTTDSVKRLGFYYQQNEFKKAVDLIITRIELHQNMGNDETALLVKKSTGSGLKKIPVFAAAEGILGGNTSPDSPESLYCSVFGIVHKFIDKKYNGSIGEGIKKLFSKNKKKVFFKKMMKELTHKPKEAPQKYFNKYLAEELVKEDRAGNIVFDIHTFVRRTKELTRKLGFTLVFKMADGRPFPASVRTDY